jgi:hypothetical protein
MPPAHTHRPLTVPIPQPTRAVSPGIVADVQHALEVSEIDPARVVLEVTESSFIESSTEIIDTLHSLKGLGVRLAIDDFGTGYASISNLKSMPVDILKVDKSFLASCTDSNHGGELLEAVVNIGRVLSLTTVAEGIEQPAQLSAAQGLGCDLAQGYLFSRPVPAAEAEQIIAGETTVAAARAAALASTRAANHARSAEAQTEQGRERRSIPTSVIPAEVILILVGTLPRSSSLRSTDSPLDAMPDRSGSSKASARSELAICT